MVGALLFLLLLGIIANVKFTYLDYTLSVVDFVMIRRHMTL
jgi:hypothetical protein